MKVKKRTMMTEADWTTTEDNWSIYTNDKPEGYGWTRPCSKCHRILHEHIAWIDGDGFGHEKWLCLTCYQQMRDSE